MNTPHTTISHSLIRGILFAAILCLLFTGVCGATENPKITVSTNADVVSVGDDIDFIVEITAGNSFQYYVLGPTFFESDIVHLENGATKHTVSLKLDDAIAGDYFIVVQHPMRDGVFNITSNGTKIVSVSYPSEEEVFLFDVFARQPKYAFAALYDVLSDKNIDDIHATTIFTVRPPSNPTMSTPPSVLPLNTGWNFISVPKYLDASCDTAGELFASLDTGGMSILGYDAKTRWYTLKADTPIKPLEGYWVYSKNAKTIPLTYSADINVPPTKAVYQGWNAVGLSAEKPMTAKSAFANLNWVRCLPWDVVEGKWGTVIVKGGSAENSEELKLTLGSGNWLYVEADGTYTGNTA